MVNFSGNKFYVRKKFWAMAGECSVYDAQGNLVYFVKQKKCKLKEDIIAYSDDSMKKPVLKIQFLPIVGLGVAYNIIDAENGEKLGTIQRKGLKSIIKDEWVIIDGNDVEIAIIDKVGLLSLLSRFFDVLPKKYVVKIKVDGLIIAHFRQKTGSSVYKATHKGALKEFSPPWSGGGEIASALTQNSGIHEFKVNYLNTESFLERRLGMGALLLLLVIEG